MRKVVSALGWVALVIAGALVLLGLLAWPPGGLMFALPYLFLLPGALLAVVGLALVLLTRRRSRPERKDSGAQ